MKALLKVTIVLHMCLANAASATTILHVGTLIDGVSDTPQDAMSIIVEADRIDRVVEGYIEIDQATVIDLKQATLMPGFIDMHVHLDGELNPPGSYSERFYMNSADIALRSTHYAALTLKAGFTTVRDLGTSDIDAISALRDAINQDLVMGPRIFMAGKSLATTGGHADPTNGIRSDLRHDPGPKEGVLNGPDDAYKAVRQRYKDGSDVIKLTVTGGVLSLAKSGDNPQFTDRELEAVVAAARDYGFKVAVHAHGAEGMKRAIIAGVDSVEHGTYMDDEAMALMKASGTWYVPTIAAGKWVAELAEQEGKLPAVVRPKAAAVGPQIQDTFAKAYAFGVKIAFGTDTGVSPHGQNAKEFQYMVEAGMPPMAAIQSATRDAATLLGELEDLGTIEVGKYADFVAVDGDPLKDISILMTPSFVMKGGEVYDLLSR